MPLFRVDTVGDDARLALWQMTAEDDALPVPAHSEAWSVHSPWRRREILVTYALLRELTGDATLRVAHDASRKPVVEGWHVSISHTKGWGGVIVSRGHEVAVDIEYQSDRVSRVAKRFIRPDEDGDGLSRQLISWSAKETVYKFYSEQDLRFFEMRLQPYVLANRGELRVENLKAGRVLPVSYELNDDFVLTYAVGA